MNENDFEILPIEKDDEQKIEKKFIKMEDLPFDKKNFILGSISTAAKITNQVIYSQGTYIVKYKKSLGELARVKGEKNLLRGYITKNGKITGQATLRKAPSNLPFVLFEIASFVTAQHYLKEIGEDLKGINNKLDNIEGMLVKDKQAKIKGDYKSIIWFFNNKETILKNEKMLTQTINDISKIKNEALIFTEYFYDEYKSNLEKINYEFQKRHHIENNKTYINKFYKNYKNLLWAIELLVLTSWLELFYLEIVDDNNYFKNVINQIKWELKKTESKELDKFFKEFRFKHPHENSYRYFDESLEQDPFILRVTIDKLARPIGRRLCSFMDKKENKKIDVKNDIVDQKNKFEEECKSLLKEIKSGIHSIELLDKEYNSQICLLVKEGEIYLGYEDDELLNCSQENVKNENFITTNEKNTEKKD